MRIPIFRRISSSDMSTIPKLLVPINSFFEIVRQALDRNITFSENISCQIKELTFSTNGFYTSGFFEPIFFESELSNRATGLLILQISSDGSFPSGTANWEDLGNGQIKINFISGLDDSKLYNIRILLI